MRTSIRAVLCGTVLALALSSAPVGAQIEQAARPQPRMILNAQGHGPDQLHATRTFRVPRAWQVRWGYSCIDRPGRPSIFSVSLTSPGNIHRVIGAVITRLGSQEHGTVRMHRAGTFRMRIVTPCVWNVQVMR